MNLAVAMRPLILMLSMVAACCHAAIPAGPLSISERGRDLIVEYETGGRAYYEKRLQHPTYPGGASGVTVGIGYDCGYNTRAQILADWAKLPAASRDALAGTAGVKGYAAKVRASAVRWVLVPWTTAQDVFVVRTMPRFGGLTASAFPGVTATHGHVQGAMLSIVFNRGASMSGSSRLEMRNIRGHVAAGRINSIPREIRGMKRLWQNKGLPGLIRRREAEAKLIETSYNR